MTPRGKVLQKSTKLYQLSKNRTGINNTMIKRKQLYDYNKTVCVHSKNPVFIYKINNNNM